MLLFLNIGGKNIKKVFFFQSKNINLDPVKYPILILAILSTF